MTASPTAFLEALNTFDAGDLEGLRTIIAGYPDLVSARSTSTDPPYDGYFHGATLLHHVAGNPIRGTLPDNVVAMAEVLLNAGADTEAGCGGGPTQPGTAGGTVLGLLTSGAQAHELGHTEALLDLLLEHGAHLDREGGMFGTLYHTVEHRGQREVAVMLHERGVRADLPIAAGIGRIDLVESFFDDDGRPRPDSAEIWSRTVRGGASLSTDEVLSDSLLCAAVNGRTQTAGFLLDRGASIDALRPWGPFPVTPLHGAAWAGWPDMVTLLLARGAEPTVREPTYDTTPLGWAFHSDRREAIVAFQRAGISE